MSTTTGASMTTTRETAEVLHPPWCDLTTCKPDSGGAGARHRSVGTMWPVQTDEVQVKVELERDDEIVNDDQMVPTGITVSMLRRPDRARVGVGQERVPRERPGPASLTGGQTSLTDHQCTNTRNVGQGARRAHTSSYHHF